MRFQACAKINKKENKIKCISLIEVDKQLIISQFHSQMFRDRFTQLRFPGHLQLRGSYHQLKKNFLKNLVLFVNKNFI